VAAARTLENCWVRPMTLPNSSVWVRKIDR
jgi:hypothetical protein